VLKPLGAMGGASVFRAHKDDLNLRVMIETLTNYGTRFIMAQQYIPDVLKKGDKRILLIDGKPIPFALARIPAKDDFRGNLASGAKGVGVELTERDRWICEQVGPTLKQKGLMFVGLDVIGDYLTEINVTSPTCIREIDSIFEINISGELLDCIELRI
jgi:glutathione synthase